MAPENCEPAQAGTGGVVDVVDEVDDVGGTLVVVGALVVVDVVERRPR
jgi:hypothetical protein